ncbi:P-loop NTPase fold protein [Saliphagus sp. GCM10025308]
MSSTRSAVHKPNPDNSVEFGQEELGQIAQQVKKDPMIHIAVNGPWGTGKTTILDLAQEKFDEENGDIITIWYEPWRYGPDQTTLRRTFLKTLDNQVADEINKDPILETTQYHFESSRSELKSMSEFLIDFLKTLRAQLTFIATFSFIISVFFIAGLLVFSLNSGILTSVGGGLLLFLSYLLFTSLIVYSRNDLGSELASKTTFDVKEPKISEIDLFEDRYKEVLNRAGNNNKKVVVFIDDIDRCSKQEIREVITGLSTYLNPDNGGAEIAFVAAIDGPKVIRAFDSNVEDEIDPNIIYKTFQVVIPVPPLSRENIVELINHTTQEIDYNITDAEAERIAMASAAYADSNLRTIRSALCDAQWMKELGSEYLDNFDLEDSHSVNEILGSDSALYRIALIKLLSDDKDLRNFVTDASMWVNEKREGNIRWGLFDLQPKFDRNGWIRAHS